ncbi:MAG: YopX family protein [Clostridia bacterium]|nr:YopX family protein [Clostridia bacterium]
MADDYTREWKFRAWDPVERKMYSPEDLEEPDSESEDPKTIYGLLKDGNLVIQDVKENPPTVLVPMQSTNWYDNEQYEVYEGDIVSIDGKIYQVIWDEETAGYLLLGEDLDVSPGGDYLGDALHIEGNIFENGDATPEERMRPHVFRAWDPDERKMYMPEDLKDPEVDFRNPIYAYLSFGALYIYNIKNDPPMELIPMQRTGWKDSTNADVYEGDIVKMGDTDDIAQVVWSDEVGQFIYLANDGTVYPGSFSTSTQTLVIGNIYENSEMVPQL